MQEVSMAAGLGYGAGLIMSLIATGLIWLVLPRTANSSSGLSTVFAFTGLIDAELAPLLNKYLSMNNGNE